MSARFELFIQYLKQKKNASPNTIASYVRDMEYFEKRMKIHCDEDYPKITTAKMQNYFAFLIAQDKSSASISHAKSVINSYYTYLMDIKIATSCPLKGITLQSTARKAPIILTIAEIDRLLDAPDLTTMRGLRDKAMLELMYATGIKVTELIDLNLTDINTEIGFLKRASSKAGNIIPLYGDCTCALDAYIGTVRDCIIADDAEQALFVNHNGTRLSRQGCWKIIKQYAEVSNIKKDITPQILRHSLAIHLLQNGAELKDVQEMLGHSEISSTRFYAQILRDSAKSKMKKFHPRAR